MPDSPLSLLLFIIMLYENTVDKKYKKHHDESYSMTKES